MTPEAAHALQLARQTLAAAGQILARTNLNEVAAREAYLAALHAAHAEWLLAQPELPTTP